MFVLRKIPSLGLSCLIAVASLSSYADPTEVVVIGTRPAQPDNSNVGLIVEDSSAFIDRMNREAANAMQAAQAQLAGEQAAAERAKAEEERKQKLNSCLGRADGGYYGALYSAQHTLETNIRTCGSMATGFSGEFGLTFGRFTVSGSYSHDAKVAHCKDMAHAHANTRIAAYESIRHSFQEECHKSYGY